MKTTIGLLGLCVGLAVASGCGPNDLNGVSDQDIAAQWQSDERDNGTELNGVELNGISYNGISYNGISYNGISYNGISYNGISYNGTSLKGTRADQSVEVDSTAFTGVDMNGVLTNGNALAMKIVSVTWNSVAGQYLYTIKYYNGDTYSWEWMCGLDGNSNPIAAMPIMKAYVHPNFDLDSNQNRFTFGCVNAAVAKCALWGYRPWDQNRAETYSSTTKYRDLGLWHQSCQRLVRADYCGNGVSHTRNGTPVDVYDAMGIQNPDNVGGNTLEADWRPDGAYCIQHTRWGTADSTLTPGETDYQYVQRVCPSRLAANDASCSNDSASTYYKANGFNLTDQATRKLVRNQSYQH